MMRLLFSALSPAGAKARLTTLIFHRVLAKPDPLFPSEVDGNQFDEICAWLAAWFNVLPLDEAIQRLRRGDLPARALAITFDDGYADNHDLAMPILRKHGLTATFYVSTGFLDGGRMWNDSVIESLRHCAAPEVDLSGTPAAALGRLPLANNEARRAAILRCLAAVKYLEPEERLAWVAAIAARAGTTLPDDLMMSSAQVRGLRDAGMQIGAHTVSHPILARLSRQAAEREIADSKHALEALLGERVSQFAYPNGKPGEDYSPESVELVKRLGFDAAVSTSWGVARMTVDPFQVPRFTPWDRSKFRFGGRLLLNAANGDAQLDSKQKHLAN